MTLGSPFDSFRTIGALTAALFPGCFCATMAIISMSPLLNEFGAVRTAVTAMPRESRMESLGEAKPIWPLLSLRRTWENIPARG
jgi:hypothetical protein